MTDAAPHPKTPITLTQLGNPLAASCVGDFCEIPAHANEIPANVHEIPAHAN
jgi:hypothetical protein